jgi:hypothetical protein
MSIQPLFGVEMFRAELTIDSIKVIDRMNRRFILASYDELKQELPAFNFNFYNLQALFTNRIFEPGKQNVIPERHSQFSLHSRDGLTKAQIRDSGRLNYTFTFDGKDALLVTSIAASKYRLDWMYDAFRPADGNHEFPMKMNIQATDDNKPVATASIVFGRLQPNADFEMSFPSVDKYRRIRFSELIKGLSSKTQ